MIEKERGLTQNQASKALGISRQLYNGMRTGQSEPKTWFIFLLIHKFDLSMDKVIAVLSKLYSKEVVTKRVLSYKCIRKSST
jgi:DNA-binding XRE family transcriptional regulator